MSQSYTKGTRVRLLPNTEEGWLEEFGTMVGRSGSSTCVVLLDKQYWQLDESDGLREVTFEQVEVLN